MSKAEKYSTPLEFTRDTDLAEEIRKAEKKPDSYIIDEITVTFPGNEEHTFTGENAYNDLTLKIDEMYDQDKRPKLIVAKFKPGVPSTVAGQYDDEDDNEESLAEMEVDTRWLGAKGGKKSYRKRRTSKKRKTSRKRRTSRKSKTSRKRKTSRKH